MCDRVEKSPRKKVNTSFKCLIEIPRMVSETSVILDDENAEKMYKNEDERSISSLDSNSSCDVGTIVLHNDVVEEELPCYGNISVSNSRDVQFGNKTFYQGPVTIKQFVYADSLSSNGILNNAVVNKNSVGIDNPGFYEANTQSSETTKINSSATTDKPDNKKVNKSVICLLKCYQHHYILLVSFLVIVMIILVISITILLTTNSSNNGSKRLNHLFRGDIDEQDKNTPIPAPYDPESNLTLPNKLKIISRLEWLAQPPEQSTNKLSTPVPYVIIHHTASENCSSQSQCTFLVRNIQTFHIESQGWSDIGYNFLIGGNGETFEGRGWEIEGAHLFGYNSRSIGIAFIGTFNSIKPTARQIKACKMLIGMGLSLGYIQKNYKLLAARQLKSTLSPGQVLYDEVKSWGHWSAAP